MEKYFSKTLGSLVYCGTPSTPSTWDQHWEGDLKTEFKINHFVVNETKIYLPAGSKIIEGGCGAGDKVYSLKKAGYDVYGIDFAEKTVKFLKANTDLKIDLADIRKLPFPDNTFDGYWSMGVIEHFIDGVDAPIAEISRVVKPGGYLFLTVPAMSPLRKIKASLSMYPEKETQFENFYQYVYPPEFIQKKLEGVGFKLQKKKGLDGFKGIKDEFEISSLGVIYRSNSLPARIIKKAVNMLFARASGHVWYYVFKRD